MRQLIHPTQHRTNRPKNHIIPNLSKFPNVLSFNLFNIPVRVLPWFWITMALIGGGLSANDSQSILNMFMFIIAGFTSIMVHELGHALMVRKYGLPTAITLQALGMPRFQLAN